jgi:magnesium chelatase family protein
MARRRYLAKLSGPLLDRVDLQVTVDPVRQSRLSSMGCEPSAVVANRVSLARQRAAGRLKGTPWTRNSEVPGKWFRERFAPFGEITRDLYRALDAGTISLRGADRVLRTTQTIADLAGREIPSVADAGLAMMLRTGRAT